MIFYWRAQARRDIFIALIFHVALYYSDSLHLYYSIVQRKVCIGWIFYAVYVLLYLSVETCSDTELQGESPRCSPPGWKHERFHSVTARSQSHPQCPALGTPFWLSRVWYFPCWEKTLPWFLCRWCNAGITARAPRTSCLQRPWGLLLGDQPKPPGCGPGHPAPGGPAGTGGDQMGLEVPAHLHQPAILQPHDTWHRPGTGSFDNCGWGQHFYPVTSGWAGVTSHHSCHRGSVTAKSWPVPQGTWLIPLQRPDRIHAMRPCWGGSESSREVLEGSSIGGRWRHSRTYRPSGAKSGISTSSQESAPPGWGLECLWEGCKPRCVFRARFVKTMSFFCFLYRQGTIRRVGERLISVGIKKCARTEVWGTMVNSWHCKFIK